MTTTTPIRTVIGTIEVAAGTIHEAHYETAAWYTTFEHEAQTCEVTMTARGDVSWTIVGRHTHEHFPSLWGGVAIGGSNARMGPCNKAATHAVRPYNYTAAEMVEAGTITLNDAARLEVTWHDHPISCMGYVTVYGADTASGMAYEPCECEVHEDAHFRPTITERNARGHLPFGYKPGLTDHKRHVKIVWL